MIKFFLFFLSLCSLSYINASYANILLPKPDVQTCTDKVLLDKIETLLQNDFSKHAISEDELKKYYKFSSQCLAILES